MNYGIDDDKPTKFTFFATCEDGSFVREFENKEETWLYPLYEFVQFLRGLGFIISEDSVQVKDEYEVAMNKYEPPVYNNLSDTIYN